MSKIDLIFTFTRDWGLILTFIKVWRLIFYLRGTIFYIYIYTHTYIHTYIHTHIYTYILGRVWLWFFLVFDVYWLDRWFFAMAVMEAILLGLKKTVSMICLFWKLYNSTYFKESGSGSSLLISRQDEQQRKQSIR